MSNTVNAQLGDPGHGGALFLLPREVRDEIYRLLVKGRYLAKEPMDQYDDPNGGTTNGGKSNGEETNDKNKDNIDCEELLSEDEGPDFSIFRVSKFLSDEAKEILYSESVFRFVIDWNPPGDNEKALGKVHRLKRVASLMMNVVLDVECPFFDTAEWFYGHNTEYAETYERSMNFTMDLFQDMDIKRHSLHLRLLRTSTDFALWSTSFGRSNRRSTVFRNICQRLKSFLGVHVATVEVMLARELLESSAYHGLDDTEQSRSARELVSRITHAIREELEPAFGPALSTFKSSARKMPTSEENLMRHDDVNLVGFLGFHPRKHSVEEKKSR